MKRSRRWLAAAIGGMAALGFASAPAFAQKTTLTGEIIDTWCYLSGVMGGAESVVGTSHHTCAVWCAAGGIPVGMLGEDGTLYMVLKLNGAGTADGNDQILSIQSHKITAEGQIFKRDGLNYFVLDRIVADAGIVNKTHEDFGFVPPIVVPESVIEKVKKQ